MPNPVSSSASWTRRPWPPRAESEFNIQLESFHGKDQHPASLQPIFYKLEMDAVMEMRNKAHIILRERTKTIYSGICAVLQSEEHIQGPSDISGILHNQAHPSYRKVLETFYSFLALCTSNPFVLGHGIDCNTCTDHWAHLVDHMGDRSGDHADTFDTMARLPSMWMVKQTMPELVREGVIPPELTA